VKVVLGKTLLAPLSPNNQICTFKNCEALVTHYVADSKDKKAELVQVLKIPKDFLKKWKWHEQRQLPEPQ